MTEGHAVTAMPARCAIVVLLDQYEQAIANRGQPISRDYKSPAKRGGRPPNNLTVAPRLRALRVGMSIIVPGNRTYRASRLWKGIEGSFKSKKHGDDIMITRTA